MSTGVALPWARAAEPVVTVVIPTRNRPAFLQRALTTVLNQVDVELEVILVDDGSEPALADQPELAHILRDRRVRLVRFESPRGVTAARNEGILRARGRWTAFMDDGDVWAATKLSAQMAALREDPLAMWSCTGEVQLDADLNVLGVVLTAPPDEVRDQIYRSNSVPGGGSSVVASTQKLRDLEGFDPDFSVVADWEMWIRLADFSRPAVVVKPLVGRVQGLAGRPLNRRLARGEVERLERKHEQHRQPSKRVRVDRVRYQQSLGQKRRVGRLLRAWTRPPAPVEIRIEPSELEWQIEQWRAADQAPTIDLRSTDRPARAHLT